MRKDFWEFIFLGANIDAAMEAEKIGIDRKRSSNYVSDGIGTKLSYGVLAETMCSFRNGKMISDDWNEKLSEDLDRRG